MSMTWKEAIAAFEEIKLNAQTHLGKKYAVGCDEYYQTKIDLSEAALTALRGPTREQVERMRGEWIPVESDFGDWCDWKCSACHSEICYDDPMERRWLSKFCPACGSPMSDEAVDMMLERLEALKDVEND